MYFIKKSLMYLW